MKYLIILLCIIFCGCITENTKQTPFVIRSIENFNGKYVFTSEYGFIIVDKLQLDSLYGYTIGDTIRIMKKK